VNFCSAQARHHSRVDGVLSFGIYSRRPRALLGAATRASCSCLLFVPHSPLNAHDFRLCSCAQSIVTHPFAPYAVTVSQLVRDARCHELVSSHAFAVLSRCVRVFAGSRGGVVRCRLAADQRCRALLLLAFPQLCFARPCPCVFAQLNRAVRADQTSLPELQYETHVQAKVPYLFVSWSPHAG
jgi:hypothetical protein